MKDIDRNLDPQTVKSFGDEWSRLDQRGLSDAELGKIFEDYFAIFPWDKISSDSVGFDMGCGSGRWARFVAPRVGTLHCIDPSKAIDVARNTLSTFSNVIFHQASVGATPLPERSQDFGYSLGVLHHIPDTKKALADCVKLLKPGAPFLIYLYYALDNRPFWYRLAWRLTNVFRLLISNLPNVLKNAVTNLIAALVYFPFARLSRAADNLGLDTANVPLSYYKDCSFYTMRTDARDRFGTPLEKRFTRSRINQMMKDAGLGEIVFSERAPFWCAVGIAGKT